MMDAASTPAPQRPTVIGTLAQFRGPPRGLQFGNLGRPRPVTPVMTAEQEAKVHARLAPVLARLERQRRAWFGKAESDLRLKAGGAALAGFVLGWTMGGLVFALAMMLGGALFALLLVAGTSNEGPRAAVKHAVLDELADELFGLRSVPPEARAAALSKARVDGWQLLPPVREIIVDDRLTGTREGCAVAVSRVGFQFGNRANATTEAGGGLAFVIAEVTLPDAPEDVEGITVILGTDGALVGRIAPTLSHRLPRTATGDAEFDARYAVFGALTPLSPAARAAFAALEAVTRSDRSTTAEVPPGTGLRPAVVIRPGRLVVLTPLALFDGALEPPAFWEPLDPAGMIPAFASDLAILNDHLTAALTLSQGIFQ